MMIFPILLCAFVQCIRSDSQRSPLDEGNDIIESSGYWPYGEKYSEEKLADCGAACSQHVLPVLSSLLNTQTNRQRIQDACSEFDKAESCMSQLTHCPRNELYSTLSSGIRYMCVEQRDAFEANSECMDKVNDKVHQECDVKCHPDSLVNGFALKDAFTKGFAEGLDMGIVKKFIDPHLSKLFFSESCRIGQCILQCFRNKFNLHCDGSAGSLLAEAIVRPFASAPAGSSHVTSFIKAILPMQCSFLLDQKTIRKFRIDPALDAELKRMYAGHRRTARPTEERVVEAITAFHPAASSPFHQKIKELEIDSPIDIGYKALSRARRTSDSTTLGTLDDKRLLRSIFEEDPIVDEETEGDYDDENALESSGRPEDEEKESGARGSKVDDSVQTGKEASYVVERDVIKPTWSSVDDVDLYNEPSGIRIEMGAEPGVDGVTVLHLERTIDNADLYLAQWIKPHQTYRVDVNVEPEDEGEFICLLRTYKAFAVNKLTDEDIEELVDGMEDDV